MIDAAVQQQIEEDIKTIDRVLVPLANGKIIDNCVLIIVN